MNAAGEPQALREDEEEEEEEEKKVLSNLGKGRARHKCKRERSST